MTRRAPLERLEELATEVYGRGTAVSIDGAGAATTVTIWNSKGFEIVKETGTRAAIGALVRKLTDTARVPDGARDGCQSRPS